MVSYHVPLIQWPSARWGALEGTDEGIECGSGSSNQLLPANEWSSQKAKLHFCLYASSLLLTIHG